MRRRDKLIVRLILAIFVALSFIVLDYRLQWLHQFRSALSLATAPFYRLVNAPKDLWLWGSEQLSSRQQLQLQNERLNQENILLHAQLQKHNELLFENQQFKKALDLSYQFDAVSFLLADIVDIKHFRTRKYLMIDKGITDGVTLGQVVIGINGVVGYVTHTDLLQSTVLLISDPTHKVPVKNQRNGLRGIISGVATFEHHLTLSFAANNSDIKVSDIFVTSHLGGKFPAGFPVGEVVYVENNLQQNFMTVLLKPIENLAQLNTVLLLSEKSSGE